MWARRTDLSKAVIAIQHKNLRVRAKILRDVIVDVIVYRTTDKYRHLLRELLKDDEPLIRIQAAETLLQDGDMSGLPVLIEVVKSPNSDYRLNAIPDLVAATVTVLRFTRHDEIASGSCINSRARLCSGPIVKENA